MSPIDFYKLKLMIRSLPNSKTFPRYFHSYMLFLVALAGYNLITICLIYDDFMPRIPALFLIAIPLIFFHIFDSIESEYRNVTRDRIKEVIVHIRLKQFQSLREKIEDNPEILKEKVNDKSLLYWAKHHNNLQAHSILIGELKKFQSK